MRVLTVARAHTLLTTSIEAPRAAFAAGWAERPFTGEAIVVLPAPHSLREYGLRWLTRVFTVALANRC